MAKKTNPENLLEGILSEDQIDALVNSADSFGQGQSGIEELLAQMTKAVLERALETEISDHLGYESGDPAGVGTGNSRNGKTTKTVETLQGPIEITVPRDRNGSFEPALVPKRYIDAIWLKIRDGGAVKNKACHIAVGVDMEGRKQVLGMWIADQEGAKFWANVLAQLSGPVKLPVGLP